MIETLHVDWADMLRQMAELPRMEAMVRTPTLLSYYIASNMPLQDATRQELLEVDGTVYRLRREIELLESMDQLRCKRCMVRLTFLMAYTYFHGYQPFPTHFWMCWLLKVIPFVKVMVNMVFWEWLS